MIPWNLIYAVALAYGLAAVLGGAALLLAASFGRELPSTRSEWLRLWNWAACCVLAMSIAMVAA